MAGGKESPRQKMINMMYLVLTAMLALQVSNAILQKFVLLNLSLEQANSAADNSNNRTLAAMNEAVEKAGGKPEYRQLYNNATVVRKKTADLIKYIEGLKSIIIQDAGGGIQEGAIKNLAEEEKVANIFVKNKKGYELKGKLNEYVAEIQKFAPNIKFVSLALDAKDDNGMKNTDAITRSKDFAELMFAQTPVPAALAGLSQKQSEIRRYESEILDYLASQVGAKEIKFDKIFAVVIPDSRTVVAGQTYKAEIAIGAYSSAITPTISINGSGLPVKEGKGTYEVRTSGGNFDANGQMKRSYVATVSYPKPDGTRETVTQEEEYTVLKPSVEIMSQSMPALYFKCANRIQTSSPGLRDLFKPTFSGSGAEFIPGGGGKVTIVPNLAKVNLQVNNDGIALGSFAFQVRKVPKPTIIATANGTRVSDDVSKRGLPASQVRVINVNALADEDFKATNPEDATFRVASFNIYLASGTRPKGKLENQSGNVNVGSLAQQAEPGDRYLITINKVQRKNFKGEIEDVPVGEMSFTIPLR
ncbi:type IX secretion system motor protein PorM/GldM [Lacihabitans soyangensis]|uniref:Gliding motility protein GldM n=1 Tax=Lacihabitans soyangensis TaxID=869394 RepID=A0AAE3H4U5_9BACT|nr:gliding motility protein GldM [Lacihabitans soyangensis]MCP9763035.1 gliding motility protein GldM [Lacihabitans soyangensis]